MQFLAYSHYKNSGVEWLGNVPSHWDIVKSKVIFGQSSKRALSDDEQLTASQKYGVIPQSLFMEKEDQKVVLALKGIENFKHIDENDFVISLRSFQGGIELCHYSGCVSPAYTVLKSKILIDKNYWAYLFKDNIYIQALNTAVVGIREGKNISYNNFGDILVPVPTVKEQNQIAQFLDNETAKIDHLIAKQEQLIELLEEQRKSVVSHAVTKGLDPNAPMKDSGVEWLGEVPKHWKVLQNRHIFDFSKGLSITKENLQATGIPCVSYGEVHSKLDLDFDPNLDDMKYVSENYLITNNNCLLNYGDFIFADTSEDFEGSGNFSYLNSKTPVFAGYHTVIARLKTEQNPRFFAYVFESNAHRKQIQTQVKGIKVFSITQGILKNIYSWLPPLTEQNAIVDYLDNECQKIEQLKIKQQQLINQLKEYRTSVISHAVTGKIDIRELL